MGHKTKQCKSGKGADRDEEMIRQGWGESNQNVLYTCTKLSTI